MMSELGELLRLADGGLSSRAKRWMVLTGSRWMSSRGSPGVFQAVVAPASVSRRRR